MKIASLFVALWPLALFAGTIDPKANDESHVKYGEGFHCVLRLSARQESGVRQFASAVAIDPTHVVTAAHVVEGTHDVRVVCRGTEYAATKVRIHPDYDLKKLGVGDIAVITLGEPLPLKTYPPLYSARDEAGAVASLAGYGMFGTFTTGAKKSDNKKRGGSNVVDAVTDSLLICSVSGVRRTSMEFLIGSGDSGGGLFIGDSLAGLHSYLLAVGGSSPNSKSGEESYHSRVSEYRWWILRETKND